MALIESDELDEMYEAGMIAGGCGEPPMPPPRNKYHRWVYTAGYIFGTNIRNTKKNS